MHIDKGDMDNTESMRDTKTNKSDMEDTEHTRDMQTSKGDMDNTESMRDMKANKSDMEDTEHTRDMQTSKGDMEDMESTSGMQTNKDLLTDKGDMEDTQTNEDDMESARDILIDEGDSENTESTRDILTNKGDMEDSESTRDSESTESIRDMLIDKDDLEDIDSTRDINSVEAESSRESDNIVLLGDRDGVPPPKKRKRRGITKMNNIIRDHNEGEPRMKVELNEDDVPIGDSGTKFMSSVGVHARSIVPINIAKWTQVPVEKKNDVWDALMEEFEVDQRIKKMILGDAGKAWRHFKSYLTKMYIIPFMDRPELLMKPPEKYSFVRQKEWEDFVASRLTPTFLKKRKEAQERCKKIKYYHRTGRRSFANLKEELRRKKKGGNVERATLWKVARIPKQGPIDEETKAVLDKIDELSNKVEIGEITPEGRNDVLTMALGSDEHAGRVRGAGHGITLTKYFGRQNPTECNSSNGSQNPEEITRLKQDVKMAQNAQETLEFTVAKLKMELEVLRRSNTKEHAIRADHEYADPNLSGVDEQQIMPFAALHRVSEPACGLGEGEVCQLALHHRDNIVAHRTAWLSTGPDHLLHGVPLGLENARVVINVAEKGQVLLPIPPDAETLYVIDAVGTFIAWPRTLIVMPSDKEWIVPENQLQMDVPEDVVPITDISFSKKGKETSTRSSTAKVKRGTCYDPQSIQMMLIHSYEDMGSNDTLDVVCPRVVFGNSFLVKLKRNEIVHLCEEERIKANVITVYMRYLHEYIRVHNLGGRFFFMSPGLLAIETGKANDQVQALAERLEAAQENHLVFTPYLDGVHWMFGIIRPYAGTIDWLDPSRNAPVERFKRIVNMALNLWNSSRVSSVKYTYCTWKSIKCPEQLNSYESGYYVMRYMRDIVHGLNTENYNEWKNKARYSQEELDEVRMEWCSFLLSML